jgi:hypothetical protein
LSVTYAKTSWEVLAGAFRAAARDGDFDRLVQHGLITSIDILLDLAGRLGCLRHALRDVHLPDHLYAEHTLGLSAVQTGIRFLPLTGAIFVTAGIAGRLTTRVPRRVLIATGFAVSGAGLLLMRGLTPSSEWTHLPAGMIVSGIGGGLISTPLVSTAVGVVAPARAGMASGINATLRQVGIATGVAGLGTILASHVRTSVVDGLSSTALAGHAHTIADAISTGGAPQAIASTPGPLRGLVAGTARAAIVSGLNTILLIAAVASFAAAAASFVLIRERDFVTAAEEHEEQVDLPVAA